MANFNICVSKTLIHEGGYVCDPNDSGGDTKYGISKKYFPDTDIKNLTVLQAEGYYQDLYWNCLYDDIESQDVCCKIFDLGVLFGVNTVIKALQILLSLKPDGLFGPNTLAAVNAMEPDSLVKAIQTTFVSHAMAIGAAHPEDRGFVQGWINRINS